MHEAVKQAAVADRIVLTKTDLIDAPESRAALAALRDRLRALNPAAPVLDARTTRAWRSCSTAGFTIRRENSRRDALARRGSLRARIITTITTSTATTTASAPSRWRRARPSRAAFEMFLDLLRSLHGPNLLRLKGIVKLAETPDKPIVIHGVQHVFHPPVTLPAWPDADRRTRLVFIVSDIAPRAIEDLFDAFLGVAPVQAGPRRAGRQPADAVRRRGSSALAALRHAAV